MEKNGGGRGIWWEVVKGRGQGGGRHGGMEVGWVALGIGLPPWHRLGLGLVQGGGGLPLSKGRVKKADSGGRWANGNLAGGQLGELHVEFLATGELAPAQTLMHCIASRRSLRGTRARTTGSVVLCSESAMASLWTALSLWPGL
jgi:hypothetical protein